MSRKNTLALSVIMKNEEDHIDRFFESLDLRQFDQIVVVDTGSTDKSLEKLAAWKPKIKELTLIQIEWPDDFAKARQVGLDACKTDYMFWADLDDVLQGTECLKHIINENPHIDSFVMKYNYAIEPTTGAVTCVLWRERLVKCGKHMWKGRLHEVLCALEPIVQIKNYEVIFNHFPRSTNEANKERKERNLSILHKALKDDPNEPRTYFYLGNAYMGTQDFSNAIKYYQEYVKRSDWDQEKYIALTRIAKVHLLEGRVTPAINIACTAMNMVPKNPMAYYVLGEINLKIGKPERALAFFEDGLSKPQHEIELAENPEEYTYIPKLLKFDALFQCKDFIHAYSYGKKIEDEILNPEMKKKFDVQMVAAKEMAQRMDITECLIKLRKYLIINDEILKSAALTKCIPYCLETSNVAKEMKIYDKKNLESQDQFEEAMGCDLQKDFVLNLDKKLPKVTALAKWLEIHKEVKTILDVGCNWGWIPFWLESKGYQVTAVEINKKILARANEKKKEFNSKINFVENLDQLDQKYDLVLSFDVLEHITDDKEFISTLMNYTKGYTILCTPNGCFSRGLKHDAPDGTLQPHLRVYTAKTLKETINPWYTEDILTIHEDRLLFATIKKEKIKGKKLAIYCGNTPEPWGPDALLRGCGGSEEAVLNVVKRFKKLGWQISVFNSTDFNVYDGVQWLRPDELDPNDYYDIFISWRNAQLLNFNDLVNAGKRYIWMHDVPFKNFFNEKSVQNADGIFVLSEYHKSLLPEYAKKKAIITANGIDLDMLKNVKPANKPYKMVWTSSYLRGLESFLKAWPRIKKAVPKAEFHIMYGWETTDAAHNDEGYYTWRDAMNKFMKQDGIFHYGRVSQEQALKIMADSGIFPYLTLFPEISCISVMKAQAVGAIPYTTDVAALKETNKSGIKLTPKIDGDQGYESYKNYDEHIDGLIDLLKDENKQNELRQECLKAGKSFNWNTVVQDWSKYFRGE